MSDPIIGIFKRQNEMSEKPRLRLGDIKADILSLQNMVSDMKMANRVRLAAIIERECELSRRRHDLETAELRTMRYSNEENERQEAKQVIKHAQKKLFRVQQKIADLEWREQELDEQMQRIKLPDLTELANSVKERKARLKGANLSGMKESDCDGERSELEALADSLVAKLDDLDAKILEKRAILDTPIDDLQLERLTVESLERSVPQEPPDSLSASEMAFNIEMESVSEMEAQNRERRGDLEARKSRLVRRPVSPIVARRKRYAATPSVKHQPYELQSEQWLSQINDSIDAMTRRQEKIDIMERDTIALKESYTEDQQQIEDSWSYKMDDIRTLKQRSDENEDLEIQIDEMKEEIMELTEEYHEIHARLEKRQGQRDAVADRLNSLYEIHPQLESQVGDLTERKRAIGRQAKRLQKRRLEIEQLSTEVDQLDGEYRRYKQTIEELEEQIADARQGKTAAMTQVAPKRREHVQFVQNFASMKPAFQYQTPVKPRRLDDSLKPRDVLGATFRPSDDQQDGSLTYESVEESEEEEYSKHPEVVPIASSHFPSLDDFTYDDSVPKPESFDASDDQTIPEEESFSDTSANIQEEEDLVDDFAPAASSEYESYHERRRLVLPVFTGNKQHPQKTQEDSYQDDDPRQTYYRTEQKSFYGVGTIIPKRTQNLSTSHLSTFGTSDSSDDEDKVTDIIASAIQALAMPLASPTFRFP